jgi:hypothetical protein
MPVNLVNPVDGSLGLAGVSDAVQGGFISVSIPYNASSVDLVSFVASLAYRVRAITWRVEVAGTDGSAVTGAVKKAASGTAIASGTALHSSTANLKGTAATNQTLTLSTTTTDLDIAAGDAIGVDFTGTLTSATGVVSVLLSPK